MIFDGYTLPFWSAEDQMWVVDETEDWLLAVTPLMYNDRVVLGRPQHYQRFFAAGFCYDRSPGCVRALDAAMAWDLDARRYPEGMKKIAYDARHNPPDFRADPTQAVCWLCLTDGSRPPFLRDRHCAACGRCTSEGRLLPFNIATMPYATGGYLQKATA